MRIGVCTDIEGVFDAAEAGFAYAEISVWSIMLDVSDTDFAAIRTRLQTAPIRVEACMGFIPGDLRVTGPVVDMAALRQYIEKAAERISQIGAEIIVFGSGAARRAPEGFPLDVAWNQLRDAAHLAADIAGAKGITVVMEPLGPAQCNILNSVSQGAHFVDEVNHPHLRLLADTFHMDVIDEPFSHVTDAAPHIAHTHLATPSIPETAPTKQLDNQAFFAALRAGGYNGRASVEDNPRLMNAAGLPRPEVYRAVQAYMQEIGEETGD